MTGKKRKRLLKIGAMVLCVAVVWAAAIGTAYANRSYGHETVVVDPYDRTDGLEISYFDNTIGLPINSMPGLNELKGNPDQGDGKAAAGGMFINLNAQMMLAMANAMGEGETVRNLLENMLGITDASVCYATSLEIEVAQPCRVVRFTNRSASPAELNFDYSFMVVNDADVRVNEASASSIVKEDDLLLDDLLDQMGFLDHTYQNGLDAALLMNNPYYSMEQKTMTGHVQTLLQPDETYNLTIEFPAKDMCATMVQVTSADLTPMTSKTITFQPAAYDYTVGETTIPANGSAQTVTVDCVNGTTVSFDAAANVGKKLGYWLDGSGKAYRSEDAANSATLYYGRDTMQPAFVSSGLTRCLETNGVKYYGWSDAMNAAGSYGIVTLINEGETNIASMSENVFSNAYNTGTEFTVPAAVKFVVPHTPEELAPGYMYYSSHSTDVTDDGQSGVSEPYSMLYVPAGYSVNVASGGTLLVNGNMTAKNDTQGEIATGFGMIELDGNLNVNGDLLVRGYIAQKEFTARTSDNQSGHLGNISVASGGEVNIVFQIMDFRGGTATFATFNECMPISMYSFDNIMVKADYANGSTLSAYCVVGMSGMAARTTVPILSAAENSMFSMRNGATVSTDYQYDGDRFIVNAESGELSLNYININLYGSGDAAIGMTTASYQLPLHDGMVVNVKDSATVTIDYAVKLLPGAEVNVENGATVNLNNRLFLFGLADYNPAYSLNASHFRLRTDCALVQNGGEAVTPTGDPSLNVAGEIVIGWSSANDLSTGKIYQSVGMETGIHAEEGGTFTIPETYTLEDINGDMFTVELEGNSSSAVWTDYDSDTSLPIWEPVKGLFGGMSNRIEDDDQTDVDERYISFIDQDLAPYDAGYSFGAGEQDGEIYWYRYQIDFVDTDGNAVGTHLVAPAYDQLMPTDLYYGGCGHVVNAISISDADGNELEANDEFGTNMTYTGYVGADYDSAADTMTDFDEYKAWQGVKLDNLNLAVDEYYEPVTDFVVTVGLQDSGWLVNWSQAASGSSETTVWHSFTDPTGAIEYGKPGKFSVVSYEITKNGSPVEGATLSARLEEENGAYTTFLRLSGVSFDGATDSVDVSMVTAADFVQATLNYPDSSTQTVEMPVVGGTNSLTVSIPQPADSWYVADTIRADGFTPVNNMETVTLTWTGERPSQSQVKIDVAEYAYKLVYDITNTGDDAYLTFDPVYTNEASYTQNSNNVRVSTGSHKYYFAGDPDSLELTTATTPGIKLITVPANMAAYDYQVQFYDDDTLLKNAFLMAGGSSSYVFDEHTAFVGEVSLGGSGSYTNNSHNASLDAQGDLIHAELAVSNVNGNAILTVTTQQFDNIVTFFDSTGAERLMCYVEANGSASFAAPTGYYIPACSDLTAVNNDGLTNLTNTISDGWGSVRVDDVNENKAITLTIVRYATKIVEIQKLAEEVLQSSVHYYDDAISSETLTAMDGYIFINDNTNPVDFAISNGAAGTPSFQTSNPVAYTINVTAQGDFAVTLPLGAYAHRVQFMNSETGAVEKTVYVNENGFDMSNSRNELPYFQYSGSAKIMLEDVELTSGEATLTPASTMIFDGTAQDAWRRVDVSDITTQNVMIAFKALPYNHKLHVTYTDPQWSDSDETAYATGNSYTGTVGELLVTAVECDDAQTSYDGSAFTLSNLTSTVDDFNQPVPVEVIVTVQRVEAIIDVETFENALGVEASEDAVSGEITVNVGGSTEETKVEATIEIEDPAYGVFTVEAPKPCVVCYSTDDGATWHELVATVENGEYVFDMDPVEGEFKVGLALAGDADMNGAVNLSDAQRVQRSLTPGMMEAYALEGLGKIAANADTSSSAINLSDAQRIQRSLTPGMQQTYALEWHTNN